MFVDFLTGYKGPSIVLTISVDLLLLFGDAVQSMSNMCLYDGCSLILTEPTYQSNTGV